MKLNREKYELVRARACMGQKDIIEKGFKHGTLCAILSGQNARPETLGKLAKILGVDVTEIIWTLGGVGIRV